MSFILWIVGKLLWPCLCLFDAIFGLHDMDAKMFNGFLVGSESGF